MEYVCNQLTDKQIFSLIDKIKERRKNELAKLAQAVRMAMHAKKRDFSLFINSLSRTVGVGEGGGRGGKIAGFKVETKRKE